MISDLFRSPCWSRKCLVRLPQFREHDYRGLITSPDPVLNRQKITRLCYDFLSQIWGVDFKMSTPARHVFALCRCLLSLQNLRPKVGDKKSICRHLFFVSCRYIFEQNLCAPPWRSDSRPASREIQFIFTQRRVKTAARNLRICWQFSRSNRVWFFGPVYHLVFPILPSSNRVFSWTAWTSEQVSHC